MGRRTLVLIVALLLAAGAAFAVWNFLSSVQEEAEADRTYQIVFRAKELIREGSEGLAVLSQERYDESKAEQRYVPVNAIRSLEELEAVLRGRVAAGPISGGSVLTLDQWVEKTADIIPLAEEIEEGKQAITITTNNERGVNGFIEAGDRINMILTIGVILEVPDTEVVLGEIPETEPEATGDAPTTTVTKTITRYVLQGLDVLAVGRDIRSDDEATTEVVVETAPEGGEEVVDNRGLLTLEVTPEQAERLVYSFEQGSVWLTLVPDDFVEVPTEGITIENLYGADLGILTKLFPFLEKLEELLEQ